MELAAQYAKALYELKDPDFAEVVAALRRRGHLKLMPKIYAELKKLQLRDERVQAYHRTTPESKRTRTLLELYRKLIAN